MTQVEDKQFLGAQEAAAYLNITYYRIKQMTKAGALNRVPGTHWYVKADLDRLLKGGERDVSDDAKGSN